MPGMIQELFGKRKPVLNKLKEYGFRQETAALCYSTALPASGFLLTVTVAKDGKVAASVADPATGEPYTLHLTAAQGSFVGGVRADYENRLREIAEQCFEPDVFRTACARQAIAYARAEYGDELEFLWAKSSDSAILRRKDTGKWYAVLLLVPENRLGTEGGDKVEAIDLRTAPETLAEKLGKKGFFPGYHMNKKSWYTIRLDGPASAEDIFRGLEESYRLAVK